MSKATYAIFENQNFIKAINQLQKYTPKPFVKIRIARFLKAVVSEAQLFNECKDELVDKYVAKHENGTVKIKVNNSKHVFEYDTPEQEKEYITELKALKAKEFEVPELRYSWLSEENDKEYDCAKCEAKNTIATSCFDTSCVEGLLDFLTDDVKE